ncbi:uncharacterized protein LOC130763843 [Actinidia eriantha]|uniref:uncharacterized protein LOC130763834 n=1 Tax=Actinidia eriantha TaxID=165200 RepID=UPI0025858A52|nr:uncharacterized protein LOC130763834 [Actinidia eriantha]XP_057475841.1 uncharacterized protein LOC130763843 [Actinidia eriantha]
MEVEDDVFFADLNKQISLLIMDDDDDKKPASHCRPSVSPQAFSRAVYPPTKPPLSYQQTCTRESKGTGVFIPQSSHPRRKINRQGRFSKFPNHSDHSSRSGLQAPASNYMNVQSTNSFNHKRC